MVMMTLVQAWLTSIVAHVEVEQILDLHHHLQKRSAQITTDGISRHEWVEETPRSHANTSRNIPISVKIMVEEIFLALVWLMIIVANAERNKEMILLNLMINHLLKTNRTIKNQNLSQNPLLNHLEVVMRQELKHG